MTDNTTLLMPRGGLTFLAHLLPYSVATLAALIALYAIFGGQGQDFENFALGEENKAAYGEYEGEPIHCHDVTDAERCLAPARERDLARSILWLGNSQLHAINQMKPGERPASALLAERWRPRGVEVLAFSQPNASLREHYILFEYLFAQRRFTILVLPLVFDDTRENTIRSEIAAAIETPSVRERLEEEPIGKVVLEQLSSDATEDESGSPTTLQDRTEAWITDRLEDCCRWKTLSLQGRGQIALDLFYFRNLAFGITASSKRRVIPAQLALNLEALDALLRRAEEAGTKVIAYVVPLRSDVPPPYVEAEYASFKGTVGEMVRAHSGIFVNLEGLVPGEFWGTKDSTDLTGGQELDFMHFQFAGHVLLRDAVSGSLKDQLQ
ncbi:MAG: hypothetical protein IPM60_05810 [Rhodospirillales bacterium]|nr:hypothetical protein [Rhodospirillales bacterium]